VKSRITTPFWSLLSKICDATKRRRTNVNEVDINKRIKAFGRFWFVSDYPLYVDVDLVDGLFDSIFRPEFEVASRTVNKAEAKSSEDLLEVAASGEASVPTVFKASVTGKTSLKQKKEMSEGLSTIEVAVSSTGGKLDKLLNVYLYSYPQRLYWIKGNLISCSDFKKPDEEISWNNIEDALDEPGIRPLIVFDLGEGTRLLPMVAELSNGKNVKLYKEILPELPDGTFPVYPTFGSEDYEVTSKAYWRALHDTFDSSRAMRVVEDSCKDGDSRIEWIDFRLVGFTSEDVVVPVHLHILPKGRYSSGTFAYQFIRRAEKYGIRIVGTLKKGADINVIAIYEK
jgi:hypothetical protein